MFESYNLIRLHLFLLYQISFNVLYIKSNYEFTSNTVGGKSFTRNKFHFFRSLLTVTMLRFYIQQRPLCQLLG